MKHIVNLFFETGMLNRIQRTGPYAVNSRDHENVAEHCHRALLVGYVLAKLEKVDVQKVLTMLLVHDLPEARIGDMNLITRRYIDRDAGEKKAFDDQTEYLPDVVKKELRTAFKDFNDKDSKEAIVAHDADLLECAVEAKELMIKGFADMKNWLENIKKRLKTESAKNLFKQVEELHPNIWWEHLKKVPKD
ncbi:HD domain-containing protein [Candidatus Woesearchaeota archaeon]|nr:HD domain-containing protein [Candidatus Woesearchaeota archaeon]